MLSKRIIPCLDVDQGRVVKGTSFVNIRDAGDPVELAHRYYEEGADEICFLDITASHEERKATYAVIEATARKVFVPLTVGGGVSTVADVGRLLSAGADKVSMNSSAVRNPELIREASAAYGSQCIVLAVDVKRRNDTKSLSEKHLDARHASPSKRSLLDVNEHCEGEHNNADGTFQIGSSWEVYVRGGREATGLDAIEWIKRGYELGAGEILLTSMDSDGQKNGYDLGVTSRAAKAVNIPIIASGGAGSAQHIVDAFAAGADAALLASLLHFRELSIAEIKAAMQQAQLPVRI